MAGPSGWGLGDFAELSDAPAREAGRLGNAGMGPAVCERSHYKTVPFLAGLLGTAEGPLVAGLGLPEFVGGHFQTSTISVIAAKATV
jgi:hypothetical protein